MAELGSYTTTEAVRGCLGLDFNDCEDAVMTDALLDVELEVNLDSWLPAHATLFAAGGVVGAAAAAVKTRKLIRLFSQWWCAREIAARNLLVPQVNTDGKARLDRFKVDLELVEQKAASRCAQYQSLLVTDQGGSVAGALGLNLVLAAQPTSDPITTSIQ